jgi:hypothetical protein
MSGSRWSATSPMWSNASRPRWVCSSPSRPPPIR